MSETVATFISFDYGKRRIGVAVGQALTGTATPLDTLESHNGAPNWDSINTLLKQWQPNALIVGLPLHTDGAKSTSSEAASAFAKELEQRYQLPVHTHDERLSSAEAELILREQRSSGNKKRKVQKQDIDKLAAVLILQSWLNQKT